MAKSQRGLFDEDDRLARLSELGDSLERLDAAVDWEAFRPEILASLAETAKQPKGPGGRPAYDVVLLFKMAVLRRLYNLSFDQLEYQVSDRLSFMRFLHLSLADRVPDSRTVWLFEDRLARTGAAERLFSLYAGSLEERGLVTREGSIVDATFVDAPRQRNSREENDLIRQGEVPPGWEGDEPGRRHMRAQKDVDARWARKAGETHFGYKGHAKADAASKLVTGYSVTPANVHDSRELGGLVDGSDLVLYADSAYTGEGLLAGVRERWASLQPEGSDAELDLRICEKGYRGRPLTDAQRASNRAKSKTRCRVEHVFGYMTNSMGGITTRAVGIARAAFDIGLKFLAYDMRRCEFLTRPRGAEGA